MSALPDRWIQRIFEEMRSNYGASFDRQWQAPDGADPEQHARQLLGYWARGLGEYAQHPEALRHALEHLPTGFAPDLPAFRQLCRDGIKRSERVALPPPRLRTAMTDFVEAGLQAARLQAVKSGAGGLNAWAQALREREEAGTRLTPFLRDAWRTALRAELYAQAEDRVAEEKTA